MDLRKDKQEEEGMVSSQERGYRCQTDETSRKGKGKGTGGKGEHDSQGELGGKGAAKTMKSDDGD